MKVEVGDWVKFRGMSSIYEVQAVSGNERVGFVTTTAGRGYPIDRIEAIASKFWIDKIEAPAKVDRRGGAR